MIQHLSYTKGGTVNDFISPEYCSVQYTRIQDAISAIKMCQSDVYLAKCDIEMAYRNLPLSPSEYYKFGFNWDNQFFNDKCLAMGCASVCQIFERFGTSLEWIGQKQMPEGLLLHILDDFLLVAPSEHLCRQYLNTFLHICSEIGIPVGPSQALTFFGVELDPGSTSFILLNNTVNELVDASLAPRTNIMYNRI
jgi:hypothetical protein